MNEQMLKTSWKQRIIIALIAIILLASSAAVYVAVVMSGTMSSTSKSDKITQEYVAKQEEIGRYLSSLYFDYFSAYRARISAFNQDAANAAGVQARDFTEGTGDEITADTQGYQAYYIGYCPNETVFESSFDDYDNPTSLNDPIIVYSGQIISGWETGMLGAKLGGIREITIPADLAYQDEEIPACGGGNMPLRFIVLTVNPEADEKTVELYTELTEIYARYLDSVEETEVSD